MFPFWHSTLLTVRPWEMAQQASQESWQFDPISFAIGMAATLLLIVLAYRYRAQLAQLRDQLAAKANQLRQRFTANMATRYSISAIETAQTMHLLGTLTSLDNIFVEPQLHAPLAPLEDDTEPPSLSPLQAVGVCDRLSIIGQPGSGRTTLLNHLLLLQAGRVHAAGEGERVPVYVLLSALAAALLDGKETEATLDSDVTPAQQLVQIALSSMSRVVATGVARWLRRQVEAGNTLILLDGWDEVSVNDRPTVTAWIQELFDAHTGNRLVVTASDRGYASLIEASFVPLRLAPWNHRQLTDLTNNWVKVWPSKDGDNDRAPPSISYHLTPPTPLEATIELAIQLMGQTVARTPAAKMAQVMDLLLPPPGENDQGFPVWPPATGHRALGRLAYTALQQGRATLEREEIQSAVTDAMPPPQFALDGDQEADATREQLKAAREEQERRTLQIVDCCRDLTATGAPIRSWDSKRYYFTHPLVAAYLAARYLSMTRISVVDHVDDPAWFNVLRFYAGLAPAEPVIKHLLSAPDDLFLNRLWTAAAMLAASPVDRSSWRVELVKRLAQLLVNPRLPVQFRERCLVALVNSGEAGVAVLFKNSVGSPDPLLRAEAILGLGALGRDQDLPLIEAALSDADPQVRLAAINALNMLARTGNEQALELVIASIIEAEDKVQRVAAQALAHLGPEGQAVLRDGAKDEDLIVRRAAVYGLAAIGESWAIEILKEIQQEDDEWLVRNAAAEAIANQEAKDDQEASPLDLSLPKAEAEPWLIAWAAERGEGTGTGEAALMTLMRALAEGDVFIRQMAILTLGRLANPRTINNLRRHLRDPEPSVRQAALSALNEISRRHDITITAG